MCSAESESKKKKKCDAALVPKKIRKKKKKWPFSGSQRLIFIVMGKQRKNEKRSGTSDIQNRIYVSIHYTYTYAEYYFGSKNRCVVNYARRANARLFFLSIISIENTARLCQTANIYLIHTCFACAFLHVANWYVTHSQRTKCETESQLRSWFFISFHSVWPVFCTRVMCHLIIIIIVLLQRTYTYEYIRNTYRCINIIITTSIICMHSINNNNNNNNVDNNANDAIETVQMNGQYCLFIEYRVCPEAQSINVPIESNLTALVSLIMLNWT